MRNVIYLGLTSFLYYSWKGTLVGSERFLFGSLVKIWVALRSVSSVILLWFSLSFTILMKFDLIINQETILPNFFWCKWKFICSTILNMAIAWWVHSLARYKLLIKLICENQKMSKSKFAQIDSWPADLSHSLTRG